MAKVVNNRLNKKNNSDSRRWKSPLFYKIYLPIIIILTYLPLLMMIVFSFNSSNSLINFKGFSLRWFERLFRTTAIMDALWTTIEVALIATACSVVIGTLAAIGLGLLSKKSKWFRDSLMFLNNIPIVNPEIVTAISLLILFIGINMPLGTGTMILAHISFCTPYVVLSVYPKMLKVDKFLIEASMDLGCSRAKSIRKVMIPELLPSIVSGALMSFTMSFDDFVISYFVGGSNMNISNYLYSLKKTNPSVNALSTIIIVIIAFVLIVGQLLQNRRSKTNKLVRDVNGAHSFINSNSEKRLIPQGSKEAIEVSRSNDALIDFAAEISTSEPIEEENTEVVNEDEIQKDN